MTDQTQAAPAVPNKPTLDSVLADADTFGALAAKSKDSQAQFALKVFAGAYHGAIDTTANKYGNDVDDAQKIAERYVKARGSATVWDAKAPNQRKTASCFRALIKGGGWTKGGSGEPLTAMNNLMNLRVKLKADPANVKLLDDAFNIQMKFCRVLVKRDQLPGDVELRAMCFKSQHAPATLETLIETMRKQIVAIEDGKKGDDAQLKDGHTMAIKVACTEILTAIAQKRGGVAAPMPGGKKQRKKGNTQPAATAPATV